MNLNYTAFTATAIKFIQTVCREPPKQGNKLYLAILLYSLIVVTYQPTHVMKCGQWNSDGWGACFWICHWRTILKTIEPSFSSCSSLLMLQVQDFSPKAVIRGQAETYTSCQLVTQEHKIHQESPPNSHNPARGMINL